VKFLFDACVSRGVSRELQSKGHDTIWAGDWPENPGDDEILERAHREGRILVTLDKDFGELAIATVDLTRGLFGLLIFRRGSKQKPAYE